MSVCYPEILCTVSWRPCGSGSVQFSRLNTEPNLHLSSAQQSVFSASYNGLPLHPVQFVYTCTEIPHLLKRTTLKSHQTKAELTNSDV